MSNNEAKLHLSIKDGIFEIAGSELFVTQQIENFKDIIVEALKNEKANPAVAVEEINNSDQLIKNNELKEPLNSNSYPRVLHIENKKVRIIKKVSGTNNAKKSLNTALIYLWGNRSIGNNEVSLKEIKDVCEEQGCLDAPNFAKVIKNAKETIIMDGKKGSNLKSCKLTLPGVEIAEELLVGLNGE